jgi:hypothetical protein
MHRHNVVMCTTAALTRLLFLQLLAERYIREMGGR